MNVGEFKQLLEDQKVPDDARLTIQYRGGMGASTVVVRTASKGFDWTNGQLVISPEMDLVIEEWYRTLQKGSGHDASHVGALVKAAEAVLEDYDAPTGYVPAGGPMVDLRKSLTRLTKFQKQGF